MGILTDGRYKVKITSSGLRPKGPNNLLCLTMYMAAYEWKDGTEYVAIPEGEEWGIICDHYIERKRMDGGRVAGIDLNDKAVKTLVDVFDWDGDFMTLEDHVLGMCCKITVKQETYKDKLQSKVQWLNHIDSGDGGEGFAVDRNPAIAKDAARKYASSIRAMVGKKPAAAPSSTPAAAPRTSGPPTVKPHTADSVWAAFEAKMRIERVEEKEHEIAWFQFLKEAGGFDSMDQVKDWGEMATALTTWEFVPF